MIGVLILLFVGFMLVPQISKDLNSTLDTLPVRLAMVILSLAALSYNKLVGLAAFLFVLGMYIHHHHNEVSSVMGTMNNMQAYNAAGSDDKYTHATNKLDHGGAADEIYEASDFTSKQEDQDNEFKQTEASIDEKHALITEPLGSRAQGLFPDDSKHVDAMEHGNKNGYSD
jgi:hypothetical protein